ncbi:hypothetical protein EVAR_4056_1 [Eumeta japonica]|uniref:Secreted protein n=1 Tax=Eumeta variegata TaxID=151549 RepID=A0A4C1T3V5_EUMVA|nr:hypothetical protein EVAR_4056_1 [Eumeta japonica]
MCVFVCVCVCVYVRARVRVVCVRAFVRACVHECVSFDGAQRARVIWVDEPSPARVPRHTFLARAGRINVTVIRKLASTVAVGRAAAPSAPLRVRLFNSTHEARYT